MRFDRGPLEAFYTSFRGLRGFLPKTALEGLEAFYEKKLQAFYKSFRVLLS